MRVAEEAVLWRSTLHTRVRVSQIDAGEHCPCGAVFLAEGDALASKGWSSPERPSPRPSPDPDPDPGPDSDRDPDLDLSLIPDHDPDPDPGASRSHHLSDRDRWSQPMLLTLQLETCRSLYEEDMRKM